MPQSELEDIRAFQKKFGIPMAPEPAFLDPEAARFRFRFMMEELLEFDDACFSEDLAKAADALVDLVYMLQGTALMMGLPWEALWNEVQRANMTKVRVARVSESKRGSSLDVVKPPGWQAPDHSGALGKGPWPKFDTATGELKC